MVEYKLYMNLRRLVGKENTTKRNRRRAVVQEDRMDHLKSRILYAQTSKFYIKKLEESPFQILIY